MAAALCDEVVRMLLLPVEVYCHSRSVDSTFAVFRTTITTDATHSWRVSTPLIGFGVDAETSSARAWRRRRRLMLRRCGREFSAQVFFGVVNGSPMTLFVVFEPMPSWSIMPHRRVRLRTFTATPTFVDHNHLHLRAVADVWSDT